MLPAQDKLTLKFFKLHPKTETKNIWSKKPDVKTTETEYPKAPGAKNDSITEDVLTEALSTVVTGIDQWLSENKAYFDQKYGANGSKVMFSTALKLVERAVSDAGEELSEDFRMAALGSLTALGVGAATGALTGFGAIPGAAVSAAFYAGNGDLLRDYNSKRDGTDGKKKKKLAPVTEGVGKRLSRAFDKFSGIQKARINSKTSDAMDKRLETLGDINLVNTTGRPDIVKVLKKNDARYNSLNKRYVQTSEPDVGYKTKYMTKKPITEISDELKDRYQDGVAKQHDGLMRAAFKKIKKNQPKHWREADIENQKNAHRKLRNRMDGLERSNGWRKEKEDQN